MRTLIISPSQASLLTESELNTLSFDSVDEIEPEVIQKADNNFGNYTVEIGSERDQSKNIPVRLNAEPGSGSSTIPNAAREQIKSIENPDDVTLTATVRNQQVEHCIYTKRQIEEQRVNELKRNGKKYTKKQIDRILLGR